MSQGFKTRIWGNLEDSHLSRARFSFGYKFSHRELLSTDHLESS